jgi:outer membrane protein assembly factor BamB
MAESAATIMSDSRSRRRPLFPLITTVLIILVAAWLFATAHVARSAGAVALAFLWLLLTGSWWVMRARGRRLVRLALLVGGIAVLAGACKLLLRYDGSADGTAMPKFAWRWRQIAELGAISPPAPSTTDLSILPAGLADSLRFMGPAGDGVVPAVEFETDWKSHPPREVWRKEVGAGWSGFAVAGRRAITQEQRRENECVTCYDVASGELLWAHQDQARFAEAMGGTGPRATPTIDLANNQVITLGATGILNCLDLETGTRKWSHHILTRSGAANLTWGKSSAPLIHGDHVIVSGGTTPPTLVALRRDTGAIAWQGGQDGASYSSPVIRTLAGREQIVSVNQTSVTGHDPATGDVLWSFPWPGDYPKVCQPVAAGPDRLLVTASYGRKCHLLEIKPDSAGKFSCTAVWAGKAPRTKFSSATVIGGFAYGIDEGTLACIDLATGERRWREGRYGFGQHVLVGGLLLLQAEPGFVALVNPKPDGLEELARISALDSMTWNPPTLAGRWLLVRNDREIVCFELSPKSRPLPP